MSNKAVYTFSLSVELMERVRALVADEMLSPILLLGSQQPAPKPDAKGMLPEDYRKFQELINSRLQGDALLSEVFQHRAVGRAARKLFNEAQKRNRQNYERSLATPRANLSAVVDLLLERSLTTLRPQNEEGGTEDAERRSADPPLNDSGKPMTDFERRLRGVDKGQRVVATKSKKANTPYASVKPKRRKSGDVRKVA